MLVITKKKNFYDSSGYRQPCPVAYEYKKILAYDDYENFHRVLNLIIAKKHRCGILSDGNMPGNDDDGDDDDDDDDERASIGKTGSSFGSFVRDPCSIN